MPWPKMLDAELPDAEQLPGADIRAGATSHAYAAAMSVCYRVRKQCPRVRDLGLHIVGNPQDAIVGAIGPVLPR